MIRQATRATALAAAILATTAASALAHIEAFPSSTTAGSESLVRFVIPHACDEHPTTKIEIQFPDELPAVRPVQSALWTVSGGTSDTHQMSHGSDGGHDMAMNDRNASMDMDEDEDEDKESDSSSGSANHLVTWIAKAPLTGTDLGTIEAWMVLPADADQTIWMPAVQTCQGGSTNKWIAKDESADYPAPSLETTAAEHTTETKSTAASDSARSASSKDDESDDSPLGLIGVILGALGVLLGAAALLRARRK